MPITTEQLQDFPHAAALFLHPKIAEVGAACASVQDTNAENLARQLRKNVLEIVPGYSKANGRSVTQAIEDRTAQCQERSFVYFALAAHIPSLVNGLVIKRGHIFNTIYAPWQNKTVIIQNNSHGYGGDKIGTVNCYPINTEQHPSSSLLYYAIARFIQTTHEEQPDGRTKFRYKQEHYNDIVCDETSPSVSPPMYVTVRLGMSAVSYIDRFYTNQQQQVGNVAIVQ